MKPVQEKTVILLDFLEEIYGNPQITFKRGPPSITKIWKKILSRNSDYNFEFRILLNDTQPTIYLSARKYKSKRIKTPFQTLQFSVDFFLAQHQQQKLKSYIMFAFTKLWIKIRHHHLFLKNNVIIDINPNFWDLPECLTRNIFQNDGT